MLVGRSQEKLEMTLHRLAAGKKVASHVADATDEAGISKAVDATVERFGGIDILFANAGTEGESIAMDQQTAATFESVLQVNVTGVWLSMKYCIPAMKVRGGGSIVAVSSVAGLRGFPNGAAYTASKHAVNGLVKTAAVELAEAGIRANAIAPGPIDNRMMQSLIEQESLDDPMDVRQAVTERIPMNRFGSNEEVANLSLFLASDESSYCNGGIYTIDGGFSAG